MKCPADSTEMRMAEREGIQIDYCPQCRGVWLHRGALEAIVDRAMQEMEAGPEGGGSYQGGPDFRSGPQGPAGYRGGGYSGDGPEDRGPRGGGYRDDGPGDRGVRGSGYDGGPGSEGPPWQDRGPGGMGRGEGGYDGPPEGEGRRPSIFDIFKF
jgi:uncharacterized protein